MIGDNKELIADLPRYMNNQNLKAAGINMLMTAEQVNELEKCMDDPIYFIENYIKIISIDHGLVPFKLWDFQKDIVNLTLNNRFCIIKTGRQQGKTQTNAALVLHYIIFNELKTVAILANKAAMAREILNRVKQMYEALPLWMQQGVKTWNKGSIELGNGCVVLAAATTSSSIRGFSISWVLLDEAAFIPDNIAAEFFESTYPTISSGKKSKLSIFSTPKGMNFFYKMWVESTEGRSAFKHYEAKWSDVPGRDEAWAMTTRANIGEDSWNQEYEGLFTAAQGTLFSSSTLMKITYKKPLSENEFLKIYEQPTEGRTYMATVDVARGSGGDYSTVVVTDITELPYRQVAVYRNNELSYLLMPGIIYGIAKKFNEAWVLIELNDNGESVADDLFYNYGYDNVLSTGEKKGKIALGSWTNAKNGVRTTKSTKRMGCSSLKALVTEGQYVINDFDTLQEASNFAAKGGSYEATGGSTDDIMMALVVFAWASSQAYFQELSNSNFRVTYIQQSQAAMMQELSPIGFFNGIDDDDDDFFKVI